MKVIAEKIVRYVTLDGIHVKAMDVGNLVRCKDCKWFRAELSCEGLKYYSGGPFTYTGCLEWHDDLGEPAEVDPEEYCSRAERRNDD